MIMSGHWKRRTLCQVERSLEEGGDVPAIFDGPDELRLLGGEGKRIEKDTLEVVAPGCSEQMAMKSVEGVQVVVAKAKIVVRGEAPGQVSGKRGSKL